MIWRRRHLPAMLGSPGCNGSGDGQFALVPTVEEAWVLRQKRRAAAWEVQLRSRVRNRLCCVSVGCSVAVPGCGPPAAAAAARSESGATKPDLRWGLDCQNWPGEGARQGAGLARVAAAGDDARAPAWTHGRAAGCGCVSACLWTHRAGRYQKKVPGHHAHHPETPGGCQTACERAPTVRR